MDITIESATKVDLESLNTHLPTNIPHFHGDRIADHEFGNSDWLIAHKDGFPVGHFLLRWDGSHNQAVQKFISNCPHLESGGVKEEFRKQGIATQLITTAEDMVRKRGFKQIGMAVGATDNPQSRHLYEKLGYKEWSHGTFVESWRVIDQDGKEITEREICTYLIKILS